MKKITIVFLTLMFGVFLTSEADTATRGGACPAGSVPYVVPSTETQGGVFKRGRVICKPACPSDTVTVIIENIPKCVAKQGHIEYLKKEEEKYRKMYEAEQAAADAIGVEIQGVEKETEQSKVDLPKAIAKQDATYAKLYDMYYRQYERIEPAKDQKIETVGGVPLGSLKDGLNDAASNLESIKGRLRSMGWKEEDIQKLVDYVGVDPERLAKAVREVADTVKPQMDMNDLEALRKKLEGRLSEVKGDEEKIKNTAAKERVEVKKYEADIAKAEGEKKASNESRMAHDKLADGYDKECRENGWTCAWNIPKALWERSMAALDQANMNRIDAWIGLLNFGKMWPAMVVAGSDLKAAPFTGMRQLIEKQLDDVKTAQTDLQAKIDRAVDKAKEEFRKEYDPLLAQHEEEKKEVKRLEGNLISLPAKKEVLVAKKTERENEATRLRLIAEGFRSQLAGFGVKGEATTSVAGASRSTQSLPASPEDFEKRIQQAEMQSREAKNRVALAETRYQDQKDKIKRGEGITADKKPLPALDRPAAVKPVGGRDREQEWQTIQRQEAAALAQNQRRLEEGKAAFERHYALEKKPHDLKLAQRDQEVEEAKRKVAEAEAALKKALAEVEAKKKAEEELALKKKQEEELAIKKEAEKQEAERQKKLAEEALRQAQDAAKKKEQEELAKKKALEEELALKKKKEEELALKKKQEEELALKKKAEEELALKKKAEEEAKKQEAEKQEAEKQRKLAEEAAKKKIQEELARKQEEERQSLEAKKQEAEKQRRIAEEEAVKKRALEQAMRQRQEEEAMKKQREIEEQWEPSPTPSEPEVEGPVAPPEPEPEPEVVRQEPEPEAAPPQCERGTWSPTFGRCIEDEAPQEEERPDCPAGTHWSPTLRSCQPD